MLTPAAQRQEHARLARILASDQAFSLIRAVRELEAALQDQVEGDIHVITLGDAGRRHVQVGVGAGDDLAALEIEQGVALAVDRRRIGRGGERGAGNGEEVTTRAADRNRNDSSREPFDGGSGKEGEQEAFYLMRLFDDRHRRTSAGRRDAWHQGQGAFVGERADQHAADVAPLRTSFFNCTLAMPGR